MHEGRQKIIKERRSGLKSDRATMGVGWRRHALHCDYMCRGCRVATLCFLF